jgi:hypothetical protein
MVIGAETISAKFAASLMAQGVPVRVQDGKATALAGLIAAYEAIV